MIGAPAREKIDPLRGIFAHYDFPVVPPREVWPHYETKNDGFQQARNFDNNEAIVWYEAHVQDLYRLFGLTHDALPSVAEGVAQLYETKAALEKDARFYEKAIEYMRFALRAREEGVGKREAMKSKPYEATVKRIAYIERKKARRLAKQDALGLTQKINVDKPSKGAPNSHPAIWEHYQQELASLADQVPYWTPKVCEVRVNAATGGDVIELVFTDSTSVIIWRKLSGFENRVPAPRVEEDNEKRPPVLSWEPFQLAHDEYLVGFITEEKEDGSIGSCAFHTSSGRRSQWYEFDAEEPHGIEHFYTVQNGNQMTGVETDENGLSVPIVLQEVALLAAG